MPRPPRIDQPGQWHHVMNRGAGRRIVFRDDLERGWFLEELGRFDADFAVEIHAFCLMDNHFHLLVRSCDGRLSDAMKSLGQRFTQRVNERRGVDGAIFRGRFHSVLVERDHHLTWLFRYVNENPAGGGWSAPLWQYPWSGLAQTLGRRDDTPWCRSDEVIDRFGSVSACERFFGDDTGGAAQLAAHDGRCSTWELIDSSCEVARLHGGRKESDSSVRSAAIVLGLDLGLAADRRDDLASLAPRQRNVAIKRAHSRVAGDAATAGLVDRARESIGVRPRLIRSAS